MKLFVAFAALAVACVSAASLDNALRPGFPEGRIINGHPAAKGEAPFIVSLQRFSSHFCAGSIINEHWILTAAHCMIHFSFQVVAGLQNRLDESEAQIRNVYGYNYQFPHELYNDEIGPHDIALVYIAEPFDLNALSRDGSAPVAKINLPSGKYETFGMGKLFGWGQDNSGYSPTMLQTLDVNIIGYSECKEALPSNANVADVNICTYTAGTTDGACNGDSGGPLVVNTKDGYELVGVVSWGYTPCTITWYPSVYTSVNSYMQWIADTMTAYEISH